MKDQVESPVKFSIIVPLTSPAEHVKNLLESIDLQEFNPEDFEFIFIDLHKEKKLQQQKIIENFARRHPERNILYLPYPADSLLAARNEGIRHARGKIMVFIEDDVRLEQHYFENLYKEIPGFSTPFAGGGKIIPVFEQQKPPWMIKFFMPLLAEVNLKEKHKVFPKKLYPYGINMLVHRQIFDQTGLFDPSPELKHGPEHVVMGEKKFIDKVRKAGYPVYYFHNLVVWNYIPPEQLNRRYIRKQAEIAVQVEISRVKEEGKWKFFKFLLRELLKYAATAGIGFYYLITTQWEKLKPLFQYRYWALKTLLRNFPKKN